VNRCGNRRFTAKRRIGGTRIRLTPPYDGTLPTHRLRTTLSVVGVKVTRLRVRRLPPKVTLRPEIADSRFFKRVPFGHLTADFPAPRRAGAGRRSPSADVFVSSKIVRQVAGGGEKREIRSAVVTRDTVDDRIRDMVDSVACDGLYVRS
jgi:hypothetical protein